MASIKGYILIFSLPVIISTFGILLFTKGFLLKRVVVEQNSTCKVDFSTQSDFHGDTGCWMHQRFEKTVIIIIDALRFDFINYDSTINPDDELPFQNKLKTVNQLLNSRPNNARLFRFIADPPTTTMQRIKGLTTGSLPTFVDISSNFASSYITEDNIIDQLLKQRKRIVFMGDDTWTDLFPNQFHRTFSYPSFNVMDLHTVDDGVNKHLLPEMKKKDWDVLIGHYLGVDHCGHRYGPYHHQMKDKLLQMDDVIRNVTRAMDDKTLLVVLGDHGMTKTGDHGGDSKDEINAGLFMYSKSQLTAGKPQNKNEYTTVSQIDLVPSLSLLLGTPIPYSNLGSAIPELFNYCPWWKTTESEIKQEYHMVKTLRLNAHQVKRYIEKYKEVSDEFPYHKSIELNDLFSHCESVLQHLVTAIHHQGTLEDHAILERLKSLKEDYRKYLLEVKIMCQDIWAKFDVGSMFLGGWLMLIGIFLNSYFCFSLNSTEDFSVMSILPGLISAFSNFMLFGLLYFADVKLAFLMVYSLIGSLIISIFTFVFIKAFSSPSKKNETTNKFELGQIDLAEIVAAVCLLSYCLVYFSNSYVVYEDRVTSFLIQSLAWAFYFAIVGAHGKKVLSKDDKKIPTTKKSHKAARFDFMRILTSPPSLLLMLVLFFQLSIQLASNFLACREEQWTCKLSDFMTPLAGLTDDSLHNKNVRYFFSAAMLMVLPLGLRQWLRYHGNLNGTRLYVLYATYALPVSALCVSLHWAIGAVSSKLLNTMTQWQLSLFAKFVYFSSVVSIVLFFVKPLCIFIVSQDKKVSFKGFGSSNLVPRMYNHIKLNWKEHLLSNEATIKNYIPKDTQPPLVYGLATVYSASFLTLIVSLAILFAMLLGDGVGPTMTLQLIAMVIFLEIHACYIKAKYEKWDFNVPWPSIFGWAMLSSYFFYATGHQTSVLTIRWEAAYVGFYGDFEQYLLPGMLIAINTFAGYLLTLCGLPLLIFWPLVRGGIIFRYEQEKDDIPVLDQRVKKGEFILNEENDLFRKNLAKLLLGYLLVFMAKMFCSMLAAAIHRRHLMLWKIFAPRFVYEGATFFLHASLMFVVYLITIRLDNKISEWVNDLQKKQNE